jgi:hypothetical protein
MTIVFAAGELLARGAGYGPLLAVAASSYLLGVAWLQWLLPRISLADTDDRVALAG